MSRARPGAPPDTGKVQSPSWGHYTGQTVFIPNTKRGPLEEILSWLATNNGAHRPVYANFANRGLNASWNGWKLANPALALDEPPNLGPPPEVGEESRR